MRALARLVVVVIAACSSSTSAPSGGGSAVANAPSASLRGQVPAAVRDEELATSAQVVVLKGDHGFAEYRDVIAAAQKLDRSVVAVSPIAFDGLEIATASKTQRVRVKGVDPTRVATLYRLRPFLEDAKSLESFATASPNDAPAILVGLGLVRQLHLYTGEKVTLSGSGGAREVRIVGTFHLDNDILDHLVLAPFADVQGVVGRGDVAIGVDITLSDVDQSAEFAKKLGTVLGASYQVMDWYELSRVR